MPGIFTTLRSIPWKQVIGLGSVLIEASREAARSYRNRHSVSHPAVQIDESDGSIENQLYDLRVRLDLADQIAREQGQLLTQLTEQIVELSVKIHFLHTRMSALVLLAAGSFLMILTILVKMFID